MRRASPETGRRRSTLSRGTTGSRTPAEARAYKSPLPPVRVGVSGAVACYARGIPVVSVRVARAGIVLRGRGHVLLDDAHRLGRVGPFDGLDDRGVAVTRHHRRLPCHAIENR